MTLHVRYSGPTGEDKIGVTQVLTNQNPPMLTGVVKELFPAIGSQSQSSRQFGKPKTAMRPAIALCLLVASCVTANRRTQGSQPPAVLMNISTGQSLIAAGPPLCEGVFAYRGVSYLVEIDGCAAGYEGTAAVRGLDWPGAIAGDYIAEPGNILWRDQNGILIDPSPPIPSGGNQARLHISYSGAALPRQP